MDFIRLSHDSYETKLRTFLYAHLKLPACIHGEIFAFATCTETKLFHDVANTGEVKVNFDAPFKPFFFCDRVTIHLSSETTIFFNRRRHVAEQTSVIRRITQVGNFPRFIVREYFLELPSLADSIDDEMEADAFEEWMRLVSLCTRDAAYSGAQAILEDLRDQYLRTLNTLGYVH
jgi:hypothetical protein